MRILFLGDVVGASGCQHLQKHLPGLKRSLDVDVCIINGENSAPGNGITPKSSWELFQAGGDIITTGNHVFRQREMMDSDSFADSAIIRPGNFHKSAPGSGVALLDKLRYQVCVINIQGQTYMNPPCDNPFDYMDQILPTITTPIIVVDFHAEATSEKKAMGYYLDGRVSAVIGTHTHVQTADERILPGGTGYITDAGMCGGENSVLGVKKEIAIQNFRNHLPARFETDPMDCVLHGVLLEIDQVSGKTSKIERVIL